jgi:hypothetical protein
MFPGANLTVGLQVEADRHKYTDDDLEQHAQKYGQIARLPTWRDRVGLHMGQLFIEVGNKLTATSLKHMQLDEETA